MSCKYNKEHSIGPITDGFQHMKQYAQVQINYYFLSLCSSDNCILQLNGQPGLIRNILYDGSDTYFVIERFECITTFFDYPLPSALLNIFQVNKLSGYYNTISLSKII